MKENFEILVIDDDENHLLILKDKLNSISYTNIILANSFNKGQEVLDISTPDLVIIDYYLDKGKTAVDFVKDLLLHKNVPVIIISTFFNEKVFDDILQIIPMDFLSKSCTDFELNKSIKLLKLKNYETQNVSKLNNFFFVKVGKIIKKVNIEQIEMIEVDGKYLNVHVEGRNYIIRSSLNDFVKRLPNNFIKVHQSFIVNLNFIESINPEDQKVILKTVEANYSRNFKKILFNSYYLS